MKAVIPKRRSLIIFVTIVFCAAILASSSSFIYGIINFSEDIYGNQEDVVVIYDPNASSPFTSRIPASYDDIVNNITGVKATSPEILVPGVINSESLLLRGVNYTEFSKIDQINIIEGRGPTRLDQTGVIVGQSIANRMGLSVGHEYLFRNTLLSNDVLLYVIGIFEGSTSLEDTVIAPIGISDKLSRSDGFFNHIRVKFDPNTISGQEIIDYIDQELDLTINPIDGNNTEFQGNWFLKIYDWQNNLIHFREEQNDVPLTLPLGEYYLEGSIEGSKNLKTKLLLTSDRTIDLNIGKISYIINLETFVANQSQSLEFEIYNPGSELVFEGVTDIDGFAEIILLEDTYKFEILYGFSKYIEIIKVNQTKTVSVNLDKINPQFNFNGLTNNSIIKESVGKIPYSFNTLGISYEVYVNDNPVFLTNEGLEYNLNNGNHKIEVVDSISGESLTIINFEINNSISIFDLVNISNYSHINPYEEISINLDGISSNQPLSLKLNGLVVPYNKTSSQISYQIPDVSGLITLQIQGYSYSNIIYTNFFEFLIDGNDKSSGIVEKTNQIIIEQNDFLPFWHKSPITNIEIGGNPVNYNNTHIEVPNTLSGSQTVEIFTTDDISLTSIIISSSIESYISVSNATISTSLSDSMVWIDKNLRFNFNARNFQLYAHFDGHLFEIFNNQSLPLIFESSELDNIEIINKVSGSSKIVNINFSLTSQTPVLLGDGVFKTDIFDGLVNLSSIGGLEPIITFTNLGNDLQNTGNYSILDVSEGVFALSPGDWNINVEASGFLAINWDFQVHEYKISFDSNPYSVVYTDVGKFTPTRKFILNIPGYSYFSSTGALVSFSPKIIDPLLNFNNNVTLTNNLNFRINPLLLDPNINIRLSNETVITIEGTYNVTLRNLPSGFHEVFVSGIDYFDNLINGTFLFQTGATLTQMNLTIVNYTSNPLVYDIIIHNLSTGEKIEFNLFENSTLIDLVPGKLNITVNYGDESQFFIRDVSSFVELVIGEINLRIFTLNSNSGTISNYVGVIIVENLNTGYIEEDYYSGDRNLKVLPGLYRFTVLLEENSTSTVREINSNTDMVFQLSIINSTDLIQINSNVDIRNSRVFVRHLILNQVQNLTLVGDRWLIEEFPIGSVQISVIVNNIEYQFERWFDPLLSSIQIEFETEEEFLSIGNWVSYQNLPQGISANNLTNNIFRGPLAFLQVIIIVEILVVSILLLVNITGVFTGLSSESRYEIRNLKSLGFSSNQILYALLIDILKYSLIAIFGGILLGIYFSELLIQTNNTILLGYKFTPKLPSSLWLFITVFIYMLSYLGARIGIYLESDAETT